jgi:beta-lactamase regulating signal transducer with metallopeptidase domain
MPAVLVVLIVLLLTVGIVKPVLWVAAAVLLFVYIQYGRQSRRGRTRNEEYRAYRDRRDAQIRFERRYQREHRFFGRRPGGQGPAGRP